MDWNYVFLVNLISAVTIFGMYLKNINMPWYLTAVLILNVVLLMVSSLVTDWKSLKQDERIEQLEGELQELKRKKGDKNEMD